ncbi:MAG: DUF1365 domain-containing protein [Betaproteobacteria bacterium]
MNARIPADALQRLDTLRADGFAILAGTIAHRRTRPREHAFTYPGFCLRLPLSRLSELPGRGVAWNAPGAIAFHDRDHGARDGTPLLAWIRALLAREGVAADGEVVLHTFPRMLGYLFAPVSFWVAHDRQGLVRAVLAEVCNTFGERHDYLVAHEDGRPIASGETLHARKDFHVSPFCEVKGRYAFRFHFGPERWLARIDYFDDQGEALPLLETWISGAAQPLSRRSSRALLWRYRWFTLAVIARIHWQAAKLASKRIPFFSKPAPPDAPLTR